MHNLLRECVEELVLNELRVNKEMMDLVKGQLGKSAQPTAIDVLHMFLLNAEIAHPVGNDLALDVDKITIQEYEAFKRYAISRYEGLKRQYRRSKNPEQSALSALNFWMSNYYDKQIGSGKVRRRLQRSGKLDQPHVDERDDT